MKGFKKLAVALFLAVVGFAAAPSFAAGSKYYVALTTVPANGTAAEFAANYPNISGNLYVRKIVVSNSTNTVTQTISIYDTCTSTTAATLKFQSYSGSSGMLEPAVQTFEFLPQSFKLSSPCFKKSGVTSTVDFEIFYE